MGVLSHPNQFFQPLLVFIHPAPAPVIQSVRHTVAAFIDFINVVPALGNGRLTASTLDNQTLLYLVQGGSSLIQGVYQVAEKIDILAGSGGAANGYGQGIPKP